MAGIIAVVAEQGYHDATISQIAAAAGVSRRTFYAYFSSKEESFFATYDAVVGHLVAAARAAAAEHTEWPQRARARLAAALDFFAVNPDLARFILIAPLRAGQEIVASYRLAIDTALREFTEGMPPPGSSNPSEVVQHSLANGMATVIARKVEDGEGERLAELLPELVVVVFTPFVGHEQAQRLASQAP
jgi:AcrR family transcriptional regulator